MAPLTQPEHFLMAGALETEEPAWLEGSLARPSFDPNDTRPPSLRSEAMVFGTYFKSAQNLLPPK